MSWPTTHNCEGCGESGATHRRTICRRYTGWVGWFFCALCVKVFDEGGIEAVREDNEPGKESC